MSDPTTGNVCRDCMDTRRVPTVYSGWVKCGLCKEPTTPEDLTMSELFHKLWTAAVGTPGYNKKEWQELELRISRLMPDGGHWFKARRP